MRPWSHKLLEAAIAVVAAALLLDWAYDIFLRLVPPAVVVVLVVAFIRYQRR